MKLFHDYYFVTTLVMCVAAQCFSLNFCCKLKIRVKFPLCLVLKDNQLLNFYRPALIHLNDFQFAVYHWLIPRECSIIHARNWWWKKGGRKRVKMNEKQNTYTRVHNSSCSTETPRSSVPTHRCSSGCSRLHSAGGSATEKQSPSVWVEGNLIPLLKD